MLRDSRTGWILAVAGPRVSGEDLGQAEVTHVAGGGECGHRADNVTPTGCYRA
jgi:hypothetical protein